MRRKKNHPPKYTRLHDKISLYNNKDGGEYKTFFLLMENSVSPTRSKSILALNC